MEKFVSAFAKTSQANLDTLAGGGSVTKGGKTYKADPNVIYGVPDDGSGNGTIVNVNNVPQTEVNFDSDPQTQLNAKTNRNLIGTEYNPEYTYGAGAIVFYNELLYIAGEDIDTPEPFDPNKWMPMSLSEYMAFLAGGIAQAQQDIELKYTKPDTGIPSSDMTSAVQTSLGKADISVPNQLLDGVDLNTITATGVYSCNVCTNRPTANNGTMIVMKNLSSADNAVQIYTSFVADECWIRHRDLGTWKSWEKVAKTKDLSSLPVGAIFSSLTLINDAGVHLLDGSVISKSGAMGAFFDYMVEQATANRVPSCTVAQYASDMATYGQCGKFVINNTATAVSSGSYSVDAYSLKLPTVVNFAEGTNDFNSLGNSTLAGLPNITGSVSEVWIKDEGVASGCLTKTTYSGNRASQASNKNSTIAIDASRSSAVYGRSNTVQPQSIKVFYYIVVGTTTKTDIEIDIDNVMTDLNALSGRISTIESRVSTVENKLNLFTTCFSGQFANTGTVNLTTPIPANCKFISIETKRSNDNYYCEATFPINLFKLGRVYTVGQVYGSSSLFDIWIKYVDNSHLQVTYSTQAYLVGVYCS